MDARQLLEDVLRSGKQLAEKGGAAASDRLNMPEAGPERDAMLKGLGTGAAAAGVLALLVGTKGGRKVTGTALKLGSLAAIGGVGYTAYKNWQKNQGGVDVDQNSFTGALQGGNAESRSKTLLRAMIAAAKADGHIDAEEQEKIHSGMQSLELSDDIAEFIRSEAAKPLNVSEVAATADTPELAAEVWLASRMVIDLDNAPEKAYIESLAGALKLDSGLVQELESQIA